MGQARRDRHRHQPDDRPHDHDHRPVAELEEERLRRARRSTLTGKDARPGSSRRSWRPDRAEHARTRSTLHEAARPDVGHVVPDRVQPERDPRPATRSTRGPSDPIIREEKVAPGPDRALRSSATSTARTSPASTWRGSTRPAGRAAPAGRRLRLQPPGRAAVRQADPRAPARGGRGLQVSAGDPARQPGHVGPVDQLGDPRPGIIEGGAGRSRPRRSTT